MKPESKIPLSEVLERLSVAAKYPFGMNHLAVLIHCWAKKFPEQAPGYNALFQRKKADGYGWLTPRELSDFGSYAGYDLSKSLNS